MAIKFHKKRDIEISKPVWLFWTLLILLFFSLFSSIAVAQEKTENKIEGGGIGSVMVVPTRVVLEGRKRSGSVTVVNPGSVKTTYRITFKNMRMKEDGGYEEIEEKRADEKFASDLIRYSPRQVSLGPGESQIIRILVRKKRGLPQGEYRSHLLFQAIPPKDAGTNVESLNRNDNEFRVRLIPVFGVTIPIIVRHGKLSAKAAISNLKINDPEQEGDVPHLSMRINRQGSKSLFGDLTATFFKNKGREVEIGRVNGIAVYTPNKSRTMSLALNLPEGVELKNGRVQVVYREPAQEGGKIMADAEGSIP